MERLTTTPFGQRPISAGLLESMQSAMGPVTAPQLNKWELFRTLCVARTAFGVTDRDLTVLNALLSFHQDVSLSDSDNLIVFPSNASLSERAHGMAESTLRRHIAALVNAGLILRHDSPNGKRYAARGKSGQIVRAFGFDLRPLLVRAGEITFTAAEIRTAAERHKRAREDVILLKRDALKLVQYGSLSGAQGSWGDFEAELLAIHKKTRRNLSIDALEIIKKSLKDLLIRVHDMLSETKKVSAKDSNNERHYHNSNKEYYELKIDHVKKTNDVLPNPKPAIDDKPSDPNIPLALVLKACPDIKPYSRYPIRHWHELVALASFVRGMMGITEDAWQQAQQVMGREVAAVTVAGILQRVVDIKSPGGYLRALTRKAQAGRFSPGPMIMALLNAEGQGALS